MSRVASNGIKSSASVGDCNKMVSNNCSKVSNGGYESHNDQMSTVSSNGSTNGNAAPGSKLSQFTRRIRDSCRNLRGKHPSGGASSNPDDYSAVSAPNDSTRSTHYVPMDFSGKTGRIVSHKDVPGNPTKDGYTYFRRKIEATNVDHLLTETQSTIHKDQPWYHKGVSRDVAQRILASHSVDGLFLMRECSVAGGFVISYFFGGRPYHVPIMPMTMSTPTNSKVIYSLDEGKTKFFDLLQLVEFYQLNKGTLNTKLTDYVVSINSASTRSESPTESSSSCRNASDGSLDSKEVAATSMDSNHNSKGASSAAKKMEAASSSSDDEHSVTTAVDATMVSDEETEEEERETEPDESMMKVQ